MKGQAKGAGGEKLCNFCLWKTAAGDFNGASLYNCNRDYLFVGTQFLGTTDSDAAVVLKRLPSYFPVHELTKTALMKSEDY